METVTQLKQLQDKFIGRGEVKGFKFTRLASEEKVGYFYRVETGHSIHYEIFKYKANNQFGNVAYPGRNAFGIWAWSFKSFEKALEKFKEIG